MESTEHCLMPQTVAVHTAASLMFALASKGASECVIECATLGVFAENVRML